jgi:hypothetical protein
MRAETIERAVGELRDVYGAAFNLATDGGRTLVRLDDVELYDGCQPRVTRMLLVFDPGQPKPIPHVQPGQSLANGHPPRSTTNVLVGGESWMQFSFNVPWTEDQSITRFVAGARRRFCLDA